MTDSNMSDDSIDSLPAWTFDQMTPRMKEGANRAEWKSLMAVQARTIPYFMEERDVMVQSRTGSGKTGAFLLPLLERLNPAQPTCQALVLVPTRELANQVYQEARTVFGDSGLRCVPVYGGVGYGPQLDAFRAGAHLVVGTPGRVLDHLMRRNLTLDKLDVLVFDEADRMMSMGFFPDMRRLKTFLPKHEFNAYMFSATYPVGVMALARQFLYEPEFLSLSADNVHVAEVQHVSYKVPAMQKDRCLVRILEIENPDSAIIFCNTKARVEYVSTVLQRFGYDADLLMSDLSQAEREKVLKRLYAKELRLLVATDVAARGIDVNDLTHVIQYEPPDDPESYIHRAGRTGRAGASGTAVTLVSGIEEATLGRIAKLYKIHIQPRELPSDEDVANTVSQRLTASLEARLRSRDKLQVERMQRFLPLARELMRSEDEEQLVAMLLDDAYHALSAAPATTEGLASDASPATPQPAAKPPRPRKDGPRRRK
ncbi:MAG: DEAD/DEAH box helicase [Candidatus Sumerlaeia bacterium]|nr:DEAD/DEAH box helicase [Candidatus Sumerlaeia bacterium]